MHQSIAMILENWAEKINEDEFATRLILFGIVL